MRTYKSITIWEYHKYFFEIFHGKFFTKEEALAFGGSFATGLEYKNNHFFILLPNGGSLQIQDKAVSILTLDNNSTKKYKDFLASYIPMELAVSKFGDYFGQKFCLDFYTFGVL